MVSKSQQLYINIYYANPRYPGPVDLDAMRYYKQHLFELGRMTDDEQWEYKTVLRWIANAACQMSDIDPNIDYPGANVFDAFIASHLNEIDDLIPNEQQYVCLYHTLIVLGMQPPMKFTDWVNWFNELRAEHGKNPILKGSGKNMVNNYLADPNNRIWKKDEYLKYRGSNSTQAANYFDKLVKLCLALKYLLSSDLDREDLLV